jgi:hypothetical protein
MQMRVQMMGIMNRAAETGDYIFNTNGYENDIT